MKTVSVSTKSADLAALLEQARDEDLIVRAPDGTEFMLSAVDDFEYEVARTRQNAKLMAYLDDVARRFKETGGGVSLEEAKQQLGLK